MDNESLFYSSINVNSMEEIMADWSGMQTVDPKILKKRRREEARKKKLAEEKSKQREQKIKVIAFFSGIAVLFFIFFLYVWNNESKIKAQKDDALKKIVIKVLNGNPEYETSGLYKKLPSEPMEIKEGNFSIKTDASSSALIETGTGISFKIFPDSNFSLKDFEVLVSEKKLSFNGHLREGSIVYSKTDKPYYKIDFTISTPRISAFLNAQVSGKIKIDSLKNKKIDKVTSFDMICKAKPKNGAEFIVQPSHIFMLDNKGTPSTNFVTVSSKNW